MIFIDHEKILYLINGCLGTMLPEDIDMNLF